MTAIDLRGSVIQFSAEQRQELKDAFDKFDEGNRGILQPQMLLEEFRKLGYELTNPPIFSMLTWITDAFG